MSLALDSIEPVEPGVGVFVAVALLICAALVPSVLMGGRGRQATMADATPVVLAPLADAPKFSVIIPTFNVDSGRRIDSAATHLRGLLVTRKPSLLLRAGAALVMPRQAVRVPEAPIDPVAA